MQLEVSSPALAEAIHAVGKSAARGPLAADEIKMVLLMAAGGPDGQAVSVRATDGSVHVERAVADGVAVVEGGACLVDPRRAAEYLKGVGHGCRLTASRGAVEWASGRATVPMKSADPKRFPAAPAEDIPATFAADGAALAATVRAVLFAAWQKEGDTYVGTEGKSPSAWTVKAVMVRCASGEVTVEATDTCQMSRGTLAPLGDPGDAADGAALVPLEAVRAVVAMAEAGPVRVRLSPRACRFEGGGWAVSSPLKGGKWPPMDRVLGRLTEPAATLATTAGDLRNAAALAMLAESDGCTRLTLSVAGGAAFLSHGSGPAAAEARVTAAVAGGDTQVVVPADRLGDYLRSMPAAQPLAVSLYGPDDPVVIRADERRTYLLVQMEAR